MKKTATIITLYEYPTEPHGQTAELTLINGKPSKAVTLWDISKFRQQLERDYPAPAGLIWAYSLCEAYTARTIRGTP